MTTKEKPLIRVSVWNLDNPASTMAVVTKDFRTWKAAHNFANKWSNRQDGNYDVELNWNEAAYNLLGKNKAQQ